jgi:hypothetical protein
VRTHRLSVSDNGLVRGGIELLSGNAVRGLWLTESLLRNAALVFGITGWVLGNTGLLCRIREALLETRAAGDQTSSPQRKLWVPSPNKAELQRSDIDHVARYAGFHSRTLRYPQLALWATGIPSASPTLNHGLTKILPPNRTDGCARTIPSVRTRKRFLCRLPSTSCPSQTPFRRPV